MSSSQQEEESISLVKGQTGSARTSLDQESLPLYEDFRYVEPIDSVTYPKASASPDEVREFIAQVLNATNRISSDHVRRIASRWTVGSGRELESYSATMYLSIFGLEDGWMVYKEIKTVPQREKDKGRICGGWALVIVTCGLWTIELGLLLAAYLARKPEKFEWVFAASLFGMFAGLFSMVALAIQFDRGPKRVEADLQRAVNNMNMTRGQATSA